MPNKILQIMFKRPDDRSFDEAVEILKYWNSSLSAQEFKFALQINNFIKKLWK